MDNESFTHFLKEAYVYCIPRLIKFTNSKVDAEEYFMQAMHQLLEKMQEGKIKHNRNLKVYVLKTAKNKWLNKLRKDTGGQTKTYPKDHETIKSYEERGNIVHDDENFDPLIKAENEAMQNLQDKKRKNAKDKAMKQLDEKCQSLLVHSIGHKKKLKDLQKSLGFPSIGAIKMAKTRCLKALLKNIDIILNSPEN